MVRKAAVPGCPKLIAAIAISLLSGALPACSGGGAVPEAGGIENSGSIGLKLTLATGEEINTVSYTVTGPGGFVQTGTLDVSNSSILTAVIGGLPAGTGYVITLTATSSDGGPATCVGTATFNVVANTTTTVPVTLRCTRPRNKGSVLINGTVNECPSIDTYGSLPAKAAEGGTIVLTSSASDGDNGPQPLTYQWTTTSGTLSGATTPNATLTCTTAGMPTVTLTVSDGDPDPLCADKVSMTVICVQCLGEGSTCNDHNACTLTDTCHSESCVGSNLAPIRTPCAPAHICNSAGACVECIDATDCPGTDSACATRTCNAGVCGQVFAPAGPTPVQVAGDCRIRTCDGAGTELSVIDNNDLPVDGTTCTQDICTNGTPSNPPLAYGTICSDHGGQICSGDGTCDPITFSMDRVGDGSTTLTTNAAPVFIERRKLDGTLLGSPVALPTAPSGANRALTLSGVSSTEGMLSRSADGHSLTMAGYAAAPGTGDPIGTGALPRVVGLVSATGTVDTSTVVTGAFLTQDVRTAATVDGSAFWVGGQGDFPTGGTTLTSGIWYVGRGASTSTQLSTAPARVLGIFGGQLFGTADTSFQLEVYKVGSGLPTTGSPTIVGLPGMPTTGTSPWGFVFFDLSPSSGDPAAAGLDTVYVANVLGTRGIQKWTYNNATSQWVLVKTLNLSPPMNFRALTGLVTGTTVTLVATTMGSGANNKVVVFTDDGSTTPVGTTILTGTATLAYRGVSLPPYR
jgi:hypothetical protein